MIATFSDVEKLVSDDQEETQTIEFKQEIDLDGKGKISRTGRREISKHIGGMSNSAGGFFLIGVSSKKEGGIDKADKVIPLKKISFLADQVSAVIESSLMPQRPGIKVKPLIKENDEGVLLIEVPRSSGEPCMSTASGEHKYYRRGLDGTYPMDHLQIKQQMFASETVSLSCISRTSWSGASGIVQNFRISTGLLNSGAMPAKQPMLQLLNGFLKQTDISSRPNRTTAIGRSYFLNGETLLYPGEEVPMAVHKIFLVPKQAEMKKHTFEELISKIENAEFWELYLQNPTSQVGKISPCSGTSIVAKFAAENSPLSDYREEITYINAINAMRDTGKFETWLEKIHS